MPLQGLLLSNLPSLSEQLRRRTEKLQSEIVRANYNTQFAQTALELAEFRHATAGLVDEMDDDILSETFRKTVQFTTYNAYAPLVARFSEKPCKASAVVDLLAPGLPDYLVESSSTSGGLPKTFPKYSRWSKIRSPETRSWRVSDPLQRRTRAYIHSLSWDRVDVENEDSCSVTILYLGEVSALSSRVRLYLDPEKDEEKMATFILDHAAPYAAGFIKTWRSFLLIHALFAAGSRSLESMNMVFINTFVDMMHFLDMEFDMVIDCIANGAIPDLDGIDQVRHYLESNILPDPERAEELRGLGCPSSGPGWCGRVWPNLRSVTAIASGFFASSVPLVKWFLGPNTDIRALGFASSEAWIGSPYNSLELNQFKPTHSDVIEFLDISENESLSAVIQPWEVELRTRYELLVTTQDGLWRYRLGDVVEISGFDPTDGDPIMQFVERRNVVVRFPDFMVTEKELRTAISSLAPNVLSKVVNWTTTIDDRRVPATVGFFVEFAEDQGMYGFPPISHLAHETRFSLDVDSSVSTSDLALAPERVLGELLRSNQNIAWAIAHDVFRRPTIRLVRPGTFSDFLQLKRDEGSKTPGQVKVPVVLPKAAYVMWFSNRVVQEV